MRRSFLKGERDLLLLSSCHACGRRPWTSSNLLELNVHDPELCSKASLIMRLLRGILLVVALQAIPILANAVPQDPRVFVERQFNDHLSALHPRICGDCVDYCCDRSTQLEGPKEYVEDIKSMVVCLPGFLSSPTISVKWPWN